MVTLGFHSAGLPGGRGGESVEEFVSKSKKEWWCGGKVEEEVHSGEIPK